MAVALTAFQYLFFPYEPRFGGPNSISSVPFDVWLLAAYAGVFVGYVWMLQIRFTGPEDGAKSNWRSH